MDMKGKAGSSHQLPDALSRLLRPNAAPESVDGPFPDDCISGNSTDYVGPRGPVLEGQLLNELDTLREGIIHPGGIREKAVVRGVDQTVSRRPTSRPMFSAVIDSTPRAGASHADLAASNREFANETQVATLPFHDRVAAIGADRLVVLPRHFGRVLTRSVRLTNLPDPLVRARVCLLYTSPSPRDRTRSRMPSSA